HLGIALARRDEPRLATRRAPAGALAFRRSTLAIFGSGAALPSAALSSAEACSDPVAAGVLVPGGLAPYLPGLRGHDHRRRRTPAPLRLAVRLRKTPVIERGDSVCIPYSIRSQYESAI